MLHQSRLRNFVFTLNNPTKQDQKFIKELFKEDLFHYVVYQCEITTTPHLQGYVELKQQTGFLKVKELKPFDRAHIEPRRGTQKQAIKYCKKKETRMPNTSPVEYGKPKMQGQRSDLMDFQELIRQGVSPLELHHTYPSICAKYPKYMLEYEAALSENKAKENYYTWRAYKNFRNLFTENFNDPIMNKEATRWDKRKDIPNEKKVIVITGKTGTGKTRYVFSKHKADKIAVIGSSGGSKSSVWFDNMHIWHDVILIEEFHGNWPPALLLRVLDIYPTCVQVKNGHRFVTAHTIYITSNVSPSDWYGPHVPQDVHDAVIRRITEYIKL